MENYQQLNSTITLENMDLFNNIFFLGWQMTKLDHDEDNQMVLMELADEETEATARIIFHQVTDLEHDLELYDPNYLRDRTSLDDINISDDKSTFASLLVEASFAGDDILRIQCKSIALDGLFDV